MNVDDLITAKARLESVNAFKEQMHRLFRLSDIGLLSYLEPRGQVAYTRKLLEKADIGNCNPCHMPMEARMKLLTKSSTPEVDATMYKSLVGSVLSGSYQIRHYVWGGFCVPLHGETAIRVSNFCQAHLVLHHWHNRLRPCLATPIAC